MVWTTSTLARFEPVGWCSNGRLEFGVIIWESEYSQSCRGRGQADVDLAVAVRNLRDVGWAA